MTAAGDTARAALQRAGRRAALKATRISSGGRRPCPADGALR